MENHANIKFRKLLVGVIMVFVAIVYLLPLYLVLVNSFKTNREYMISMISFPSGFNIKESYVAAVQQMQYLNLFKNSLIVFVVSMVGIIILGSMTAYKLSRVRGKFSTIIFLVFLSCMMIPFQGLMLPLVKTIARLHLLNSLFGLSITYWALMTPVVIFMYHGFIKSIPYDIEEAARIDGANGYEIFFKIIFPLLKPITLTVITLLGLGIWNDFFMPLLVLQSPSTYTLPLGVSMFYGQQSGKPDQWPAIYGALVISIAPIIIFFIFMQKHIVYGITNGAVKG